ncbi:MAG: HPP family protein [Acidobacteriaceae bacterium]
MVRRDVFLAPVLEAALIVVLAVVGWLSRTPFVFASLGPTAYEIVETSKRPSARPYNIIMGNLIAVLAGFAALWITGAWGVPSISAHGVPLARVWAATIAALLTVLGTLLARATQPAALSTTMLIALGIMQTARDGVIIMLAVLLITAIGEPLRRWRIKHAPPSNPS